MLGPDIVEQGQVWRGLGLEIHLSDKGSCLACAAPQAQIPATRAGEGRKMYLQDPYLQRSVCPKIWEAGWYGGWEWEIWNRSHVSIFLHVTFRSTWISSEHLKLNTSKPNAPFSPDSQTSSFWTPGPKNPGYSLDKPLSSNPCHPHQPLIYIRQIQVKNFHHLPQPCQAVVIYHAIMEQACGLHWSPVRNHARNQW